MYTCAEMLLFQGSPVDVPLALGGDESFQQVVTPLMVAAEEGYVDMVHS